MGYISRFKKMLQSADGSVVVGQVGGYDNHGWFNFSLYDWSKGELFSPPSNPIDHTSMYSDYVYANQVVMVGKNGTWGDSVSWYLGVEEISSLYRWSANGHSQKICKIFGVEVSEETFRTFMGRVQATMSTIPRRNFFFNY